MRGIEVFSSSKVWHIRARKFMISVHVLILHFYLILFSNFGGGIFLSSRDDFQVEVNLPVRSLNDENRVQDAAKEGLQLFGDLISTSVSEGIRAMRNQNIMDNVAIFVDYDNVYHTLVNNYQHHPDHEDMEKNLFIQLWSKYGRDNIRSFRAYADFEQIRSDLTSLQKKRVQIRHVYANGKAEQGRKNASDIELCIDAVETTYNNPDISCFVFVTADSDMIPVMSRLMYKGKHVELFYATLAAPKHTDIRNYAHESYDLLTFLNVDTKPVDVQMKIDDAICAIYRWHQRFGSSSRTLGVRFLQTTLMKDLAVPASSAMELIDAMRTDDLIEEATKMVANRPYPNYVLVETNDRVQQVLQRLERQAPPIFED